VAFSAFHYAGNFISIPHLIHLPNDGIAYGTSGKDYDKYNDQKGVSRWPTPYVS
jgi:hypothetical protein